MVTTLAGYALKQEDLPGRKIITMLITFTMLFGGGMIPTYIQYKNLHLLNSFWVYVVPSLVSVTYLLMVRTFFCEKNKVENYCFWEKSEKQIL